MAGTTRGPKAKRTAPTSAVQIDAELVKRLDKAADERLLGRRLLAEALLRDGLERLAPAAVLFEGGEPAAGASPAPEPEPAGDPTVPPAG